MKIKVKEITSGSKFEFIKKGDWIDLKSSKNITLNPPTLNNIKYIINSEGKEEGIREINFNNKLIPLGIAMELPKGFEAWILMRSSSYESYGIILANHKGIIDYTYKGDKDEWKVNVIALKKCNIKKGDKICQFRIALSQKATIWQKIKWLFINKIEFEWVESLNNENRGGFGSTGKK